MSIQAIKGVKDILPADMVLWHHIEGVARRLFEEYGFSEIRVPVFEYTELFARSIGASTDIVEKEMYTFEDRDGRKITLRPEGTAGVVRAFVEHKLYAESQLTKLYYLGPMFRHERPQKGRYRQFYQIGVEALGIDHPHVDIEILDMLHSLFSRLGITGLTLQINSLGDAACRGGYRDALEAVSQGEAADALRGLPAAVRDESAPGAGLQGGRRQVQRFADHARSSLRRPARPISRPWKRASKNSAVPFEVNPRLVRGLDYYTRTTFEMVMGHLGAQNTVAAGGRYDGLVQEIGGPATPGIGFALGVERAVSLMDASRAAAVRPQLFIAALGEEAVAFVLPLIHDLRQAGIRVETDYTGASLKSQMKKADKCGAAYTLIVGEQELQTQTGVLRNMQTKEQDRYRFRGRNGIDFPSSKTRSRRVMPGLAL